MYVRRLVLLSLVTSMFPLYTAHAYWGFGNRSTTGSQAGRGDFSGNGVGDGAGEFNMDYRGQGHTRGGFRGNGDTGWGEQYYGYDAPYQGYYPPYGAPTAGYQGIPVREPASPGEPPPPPK